MQVATQNHLSVCHISHVASVIDGIVTTVSRLLYNSSEQIDKCGLYALPVQCNSHCHCIVKLQLKLQETEEETDINQDWQNLKQVILEAAMEFKLSIKS